MSQPRSHPTPLARLRTPLSMARFPSPPRVGPTLPSPAPPLTRSARLLPQPRAYPGPRARSPLSCHSYARFLPPRRMGGRPLALCPRSLHSNARFPPPQRVGCRPRPPSLVLLARFPPPPSTHRLCPRLPRDQRCTPQPQARPPLASLRPPAVRTLASLALPLRGSDTRSPRTWRLTIGAPARRQARLLQRPHRPFSHQPPRRPRSAVCGAG